MTTTEGDPVLAVYIATFCGRADLYVMDSRVVVREPILPEVIADAMRTGHSVSAYMAQEDGRTHVGALDFDREDGLTLAEQTQVVLHEAGFWSLVQASRRGAHLWVMMDEVVEAWVPVGLLRTALTYVDPVAARDPHIEVFPKRGTGLAVGALRLPLMPHPKTGLRYQARSFSRALKSMRALMLDLVPCETKRAIEWSLPSHGGTSSPKSLGPYLRRSKSTHLSDSVSASAVLQKWGVEKARPGRTVKCPAHDDSHQSLTIFEDDQRVYCGSPMCPLNNGGHGVGSLGLASMEGPA